MKSKRKNFKEESYTVRLDNEIRKLEQRIDEETPARGSAPPAGVVAFASMPLSDCTLRGLAACNYTSMTAIQSASIPHALAGRDVLGAAKTGSGKTLAFVIPLLECLFRKRWGSDDGPGAIILSPTRELAGQTFQVLRQVGKFHKSIKVGLLIGGKKDFANEQRHVPQTNVIIATPGRLLQHLEQTPFFDVSNIQVLVLDECDRMFDYGFRDQLHRIIDYLPIQKQTLLFSATQTKDVKALVALSMNRDNMQYVGVHDKDSAHTPDALIQSYALVPIEHKLNCVYSFLKSHLRCKTIMFFGSCSQVRFAWELFCSIRPGLSVLALHGKLTQSKRLEVYDKFATNPHSVLFATDIASRGLDFPGVDWVVQVDCPEDQEMYIHRAGRTARYKSKGKSLLILDPVEEEVVKGWTLKAPLKKKSINPTKTVVVTQRAAALVAGDPKLNRLAKKAFSSYVRSVALIPNRGDFDVRSMNLDGFASALGLASMPNLRFLDQMADRSKLREKKNVNRKLQKLKEQIKAEKLAKKLGVAPSQIAASGLEKRSRPDDDEGDTLLTVKAHHVPESAASHEGMDQFDIHKVTMPRNPKRIKVSTGSSSVNKHVVFSEDGEEEARTLKSDFAVSESPQDVDVVAKQTDEFTERVRNRLISNRDIDRADEKERIREKHKKKRMQAKTPNDDSGEPGAVMLDTNTGDAGSSESDSESDDLSVAAQEELALSLIRG